MGELIVRDPNYIRMLQQHPGTTLFSQINELRPFSSVRSEAAARESFIANSPRFVAAIINRVLSDFHYFEACQLPVIYALSGNDKVYVHSAAGTYELGLLRYYGNAQNSLVARAPRIHVKA